MPTLFGLAVAMSDVRATFPDGSGRDCVQKIYRVGPDLALGFAGSISVGFRMVEQLTQLSACPDDSAWNPEHVVTHWPAVARALFKRATDVERNSGCHLILVSAHPSENIGLNFPRTFVHIFRSPEFVPVVSLVPHEAGSIGSGAVESGCVAALEKLTAGDEEKFALMQAATAMTGGLEMTLGLAISEYIRDNRPDYISPHLNLCSVTRGAITIWNNDYIRYEDGGPVHFAMPRLARSFREFMDILEIDETTAKGCIC